MQTGNRASWQKADPRSPHSGPGQLLLPHGTIPGETEAGEEQRTDCEAASGCRVDMERDGATPVHSGQMTEKVWLQGKEEPG